MSTARRAERLQQIADANDGIISLTHMLLRLAQEQKRLLADELPTRSRPTAKRSRKRRQDGGRSV